MSRKNYIEHTKSDGSVTRLYSFEDWRNAVYESEEAVSALETISGHADRICEWFRRIIGSVKAYKPGHLVRHDDVRALLGVLSGDQCASKAIITTTSDFAPGIRKDPFIAPFLPYRLELMNGEEVLNWFEKLVRT